MNENCHLCTLLSAHYSRNYHISETYLIITNKVVDAHIDVFILRLPLSSFFFWLELTRPLSLITNLNSINAAYFLSNMVIKSSDLFQNAV